MSRAAFFKKEIKSIIRTYRLWLIPLIFIFFGILSPVTAKFTPALVKAAMQADKAQGISMQIDIPEPTAVTSFGQWLKNLSQLGMLAVILFSMGLVAEEKIRGTLALVLTKPISRASIILSKFLSQAGFLTLSAGAGLAACAIYTSLLFDNVSVWPLFSATAAFWTYAVLILALTLFFGVLMKSQIGAGGLGLLSYFVLSIIALFGHGLERYSPGALGALAADIASGAKAFSSAYPAMGITLALSAVAIGAAIAVLNKQEI